MAQLFRLVKYDNLPRPINPSRYPKRGQMVPMGPMARCSLLSLAWRPTIGAKNWGSKSRHMMSRLFFQVGGLIHGAIILIQY